MIKRIRTSRLSIQNNFELVLRAEHEQELEVFFFTLVTGPRRSLILKLSDTRVYEP